MYNHLQPKEDETCSEEQVTTVQDEEQYEKCSDIIDVESSKNTRKTSSRRMMSRM